METNYVYQLAEPEKSESGQYLWEDMTAVGREKGTLDAIPFTDTNLFAAQDTQPASRKATKHRRQNMSEAMFNGYVEGYDLFLYDGFGGSEKRSDRSMKIMELQMIMQEQEHDLKGFRNYEIEKTDPDAVLNYEMSKMEYEKNQYTLKILQELHEKDLGGSPSY